ncbi:AAA family ATPase [Microbacterium sp. SSM24]|uniref:AAA family ATPase n=1 Tax=Microbacterium sp. SSM24 TaxID=2991714 RepID=UPI0039B39CD6
MVDLQTANVLVELAIEQGVGLAFVGDTHQAFAGRTCGCDGSAIRHANAAVELDTVHRFRDPDYATLTLRLRDAGDRERALMVAGELGDTATSTGSNITTRRGSGWSTRTSTGTHAASG